MRTPQDGEGVIKVQGNEKRQAGPPICFVTIPFGI